MRGTLTYIFLRLALVMLAVSACTQMNEDLGGISYAEEFPISLSASSKYTGTKISLDGTSIAWEEDDKIQVVAVAADESIGTSDLTWFSGIEGKDSHFASFSGFVTMTAVPRECYFIYPVKSSTDVDPKTGKVTLYYNAQTGQHEPFLYAKALYDEEGMSAKLNHVGAVLEIDVKMAGVAKVSFVGNNLEILSPVIVDPQNGAVSFASQANVQITVPVNNNGKTYIAVPPVNMDKGFSLVCTNEDGSKNMIRSFSSDGENSSGYDFSSKVGQIIPITLTGTLENFSLTASDPEIVHTKSGNLLTGTSVSFTMNKTGVADKLIEEWGATLFNEDGVLVRQIKYTNADPIRGEKITLEIEDNWKLLPAGRYTFTPYYKMYGKTQSFTSKDIMVSDPGVTLTLHGQTSYDKYLSGDIDAANTHKNTMIEGVAVSTNVDISIIDRYSATIADENLGSAETTYGSEVRLSYGNITRNSFQSYLFKSSIQVGNLTFSAEKTFHITGLPYEADFTKGDPRNWTVDTDPALGPAWTFINTSNVKYNDSSSNPRVEFTTSGDSAVRSPKFHTPNTIKARTAIDALSQNVDFSIFVAIDKVAYRYFYPIECPATQSTLIKGQTAVTAQYSELMRQSDRKYNYCMKDANNFAVFKLTSSTPSIMYPTTTKVYNKDLFKIKIEYTN